MKSLHKHQPSISAQAEGPGRWKPYLAHKDSGVTWLGEVPEHWEVRKLKHKAKITFSSVDKHSLENEIPVLLCNYVDVYKNEYITDQLDFMRATASTNEVRRFSLYQGDVLVTKDSESWDDIAIPAYVCSDLPGILCGYHLALVRPNKENIDGDYLFRAFQAKSVNYQFQIAANGITRYGVGKHAIDNGLFPIPPIEEQHTIATFLDRETAKIDVLIAKKQRLIELLQEKHTTLISQAVTKGLDPDAPMKDSEVEWLGKVPEQWEVKRVSTVAPLLRGHDLTVAEREEGEIPVFSSSGFAGFHNKAKAKGPGVVTGRYGTTGQIYYVENDFWPMNTALYVYDFKHNLPRYIFYLYMILPFDAFSSKSAVPGIDRNDIHPLKVCQPMKEEQRAIAAFLDKETAKINRLVTMVQDAIEQLKEYRTALISAAVTGKIDVRSVPAPAIAY